MKNNLQLGKLSAPLWFFLTRLINHSRAVQYKVQHSKDIRYQKNTIAPSASLGSAYLEGNCAISEGVHLLGQVYLGAYSTIGMGTIIHGGVVKIGRYCQFGPNSAIYAKNHFFEGITSYNNSRLFSGELKTLAKDEYVHVGHDVWVGHGAIILPSTSIGTGAIVGAGAVVTKDVCEYGIVGGNPAKLIKKRFPDEIIELLLRWEWWNLSPDELLVHKEFFCSVLNHNKQWTLDYLNEVV